MPEALYPLLLRHGTPEYIHFDNGPEFIAQAMQDWLVVVSIKPIQIYLGAPCETGYSERFNYHDNAVAESFFNLLQRERIRRLN